MPDYSIIEDCVLTPGSYDCYTVKWADYSPSCWTPCQCCKWWDEFSAATVEDYADSASPVDVVYTGDTFNNVLRALLGVDDD